MNKETSGKDIIDLDCRRELFIDDHLIEHLSSDISRIFHKAVPREIIFSFDKPWEGNSCGMFNVLKADERYIMYYRASGYTIINKKTVTVNPERTALLYSDDGIKWERPDLNKVLINGFTDNNLLPEHFTSVFKDQNPKAKRQDRFKAVSVLTRDPGMDRYGRFTVIGWISGDGINWEKVSHCPIYSKINRGLGDVSDDLIEKWLDSQNAVFWSLREQCYVMYYRVYTYDGKPQSAGWKKPGDYSKKRVRSAEKAMSYDFINWERVGMIEFDEEFPSLEEQLYGNHIAPYYRAPHIYIGMPLRYCDRGWTGSHELLPELAKRKIEAEASLRSGTALTDTTLIWSRDGLKFNCSPGSFITPGRQRGGSWMYGDHASSWHLIEIKDKNIAELSQMAVYTSEAYRSGPNVRLRLNTMRPDGFASLSAGRQIAEILTKPLIFKGTELDLNMSTDASGYIKVEIVDLNGQIIDGYGMDDCDYIIGDETDRKVSWRGVSDVGDLTGRPVRLRFILKQAELFSLRFKSENGIS